MKAHKSAAVVTIRSANKMTDKGRKDIAQWLRRQAANLTKYGKDYSETRFTARYLY